MAVFYIDPVHGRQDASGASEAEARQSNRGLRVSPGDTVLFKRGSVIRDALWNVNGEDGKPVTYGAYGTGRNPVFCGSVDLSSPDLWTEIRKNVWKCMENLATDACNFIFNIDEYGALVWQEEDLRENGDWWDSTFSNDGKAAPQDHCTLLYCETNPGLYYDHIECVIHQYRSLAAAGQNMIIRDLIFCNNGIHAIAGEGPVRNLLISGCAFYRIGGCVWSLKQKIRFGNAVECWNVAENVTVENCVFDDIYDSAVTHQGGGACKPAREFRIRNNVFSRCGMAAYEQRDRFPASGEFAGNLCKDAGKGFSHDHTPMPRYSEIWPQPMGHHIFLWRIEQAEPESSFRIAGNTFRDAPHGAAIYSIIAREAEEKLIFENNRYEMASFEMIARLFGETFKDKDAFVGLTESKKD